MTEGSQHRQVESFVPFPEASYQSIDLAGLAAFTIKRLQELQVPITFENLVVAMFKMFSTKYSLEGFPEYPDAARVGRTLLQLGPKYRNWARGSVQTGFVLTEAGLAKAAKVGSLLVAGVPATAPSPTKRQVPRTMDLGKEMRGLEESALFRKWKAGKLMEGEPLELFDLLGGYAYMPTRALRERAQYLENAAAQTGREDLLEFLQSVRRVFAAQFRR
jgi:hypothetical protein